MNRVACSLPGTVGEWVQGWILPEGEALVSLVVQWRGQVRLRSGPDGAAKLPPKAYRALRLARERFSLGGVRVEVDNPLRPALGLGTSTMDVGGVLAGAAARKLPGRADAVVARLSSLVIGGFALYFAATVAAAIVPLARV